jgi:hypothetical protein
MSSKTYNQKVKQQAISHCHNYAKKHGIHLSEVAYNLPCQEETRITVWVPELTNKLPTEYFNVTVK